MAKVQFARAAVVDLDRLAEFLQLPSDTRERVKNAVEILSAHPLAGRELDGRWRPLRFWTGPWSWMILVYEYDDVTDAVTIVTIQDARSSSAALGG